MVCQKIAKAASLVIALLVVLVELFGCGDWSLVGVSIGSSLPARFLYPFFHASILHALLNAWCLLSIVFIHQVSLWRLFIAFLTSFAVPVWALSDEPTVGLSCVCFFLLGSLTFEVRRKLYFFFCIGLYLLLGFFFPKVNALIHLYGYIAGLSVGLINFALSWLRLKI